MKPRIMQLVGVTGTALCAVLFFIHPSFPTPDKLFIFLVLLFMAAKHATALIGRLLPFIGLLLIYETFRGLVPHINHRVSYLWMPAVDRWLFGSLPTARLQDWLWNGTVQWFDIVLYLFYMAHFVLPIGLALLIWRLRERIYWHYITSYIVVCIAGFATFLIVPAAPPWMASDMGLIEPIHRVSSDVWFSLGVEDFPSVYDRISPNPVAAVPSLHAAFATLFSLYVFIYFGKKWGALSLVYPFAIYFGTVYQGEHYVIDEIIGALYGIGAYLITRIIFSRKIGFKPVLTMRKHLVHYSQQIRLWQK